MALVADIYGLSVNEALKLSDSEADFLLAKAQVTMMHMATSAPEMQKVLRGRLAPTLRAVREARGESGEEGGGIGAPPV